MKNIKRGSRRKMQRFAQGRGSLNRAEHPQKRDNIFFFFFSTVHWESQEAQTSIEGNTERRASGGKKSIFSFHPSHEGYERGWVRVRPKDSIIIYSVFFAHTRWQASKTRIEKFS